MNIIEPYNLAAILDPRNSYYILKTVLIALMIIGAAIALIAKTRHH